MSRNKSSAHEAPETQILGNVGMAETLISDGTRRQLIVETIQTATSFMLRLKGASNGKTTVILIDVRMG